MNITVFEADCTGQPANCLYPHEIDICDKKSLERAFSHDYVCAKYKRGYRSNDNFIGSDCLPVDCDNDHTENPTKWVTPADVAEAFPDVAFVVHYSRNHMKEKNGRTARPKFHVLFQIDPVMDATEYSNLKKRVCDIFPYFDTKALDSARFFFGTKDPKAELFDGPMTLTTFLDDEFDAGMEEGSYGDMVIEQGNRNDTMSKYAGRILKRYGNTDEARKRFDELASKCNPPLEQSELDSIWRSAQRFFGKVSSQKDYIPPEKYNLNLQLKPEDYSDVGQAEVLSREYGDRLRYSPSTDYIVYNGQYWEESAPKAQGMAQDLTDRQLEEAEVEIRKATAELEQLGAWQMLATSGKKAVSAFNAQQERAFQRYETATLYRNYAIRRRDSRYITSALKEGRPKLEIDQKQLDSDGYLLNTPSGTYDLRRGLDEVREHCADDFITKMTAVDPSDEGKDLWQSALHTFFLGDSELVNYVQEIVGLAAIGKVCIEALIIAYGEGRNGKSTFWNTIARVLGSYAGNMSADTLTVGCKRNVKPELAEVRGKRLIIAAELEEGMRLNTSNVKQLCSTDEIYAEKKYKDPFAYVPSHTLILYTNHLPRVGALDAGTWRRLIVIPFNARIEGSSDVKNYADFLYSRAGGAVLSWIIEGARRVIAKDYIVTQPEIVKEAISRYKENNDWLSHFLEDCCDVDKQFTEKSGELYSTYRSYCLQNGEFIRSTTDFYVAIENAGFVRRRSKKGVTVFGLRLKSDFME